MTVQRAHCALQIHPDFDTGAEQIIPRHCPLAKRTIDDKPQGNRSEGKVQTNKDH